MSDDSVEKSPIDAGEYGGLQLDTRARNSPAPAGTASSPRSGARSPPDWNDEKTLISEVEAKSVGGQHSTPTTVDPSQAEQGSDSKKKKIFGLRRRYFWILFAVLLTIIIVAAVVGGVVGGSRRDTSAVASTSSGGADTPTPNVTAPIEVPEPQSNVIVDSPLAMLAYAKQRTNNSTTNSTNSATNETGSDTEQSMRLFFQSAHGNIKWTGYDGSLSPWRDATPIFTDALNNTGLCVFTYLNGTEQSFAIYYIGMNGLVQEKRTSISDNLFLPGPLNSLNLKATGAIADSSQISNANPRNNWASYSMAAVYSKSFPEGPGARLFYHFLAQNGSSWVQEMIWYQESDQWSEGATLNDPWPSSHLAAAIDENDKILRLFYSAGNLTLQESYLNVSDANSTYQTGATIPNLLAQDDGSLAVIAINGDALVYYYSSQTTPSIRELNISGTSGSQDSYDLASQNIVAQPALDAAGEISLYQPIGTLLANATTAGPTIYVSWAEQNIDANSSFGAMNVVSRKIGDRIWPNSTYGMVEGQVSIPLGNSNVDPSS